MIDFIVVAVIVLALAGIFMNGIKRKKEGKSGSCGGCCSSSSCAGCHTKDGQITL